MDVRELLVVLVAVGLVLYLLFTGARYAHRTLTERRWARHNGWQDVTASMADTAAAGLRDFTRLDDPATTTNTMTQIWGKRLSGLDTLVVELRTRIGGRFDRHRTYSWSTHILLTLPGTTSLLSLHVRYENLASVPHPSQRQSGDRRFDNTFLIVSDDAEFTAAILTAQTRALLLRCIELMARPDRIPCWITFQDTTLSCHELERRKLRESAQLAELLAELGSTA